MAKPIEISFTSDTKDVIRGVDSVADSFDEVSDALRDLGKDSDDATKKIGDGAKDAERATEGLEKQLQDVLDETDKLEKDGRDAFDKLSDSARQAGRKTGDSLKEGTDRASEGMGEFKDEANSTAREAAASFDGSAESISDVFQELAANAFAGFGPAGAAAGLAAAVGIGIAITKLQEAADTNTEAKESMADLGREIYATGGQLDDADLAAKIADISFQLGQEDVWYKWGDQAKTNVGMVKEALSGVSDEIAKDAFKGLAGDLEAAARAQNAMEEATRRDTEALEDHVILVDEYGNKYLDQEGQAIQDSINARGDLADKIEEETGVRQGANDEVDYYTRVMGESTEQIEAANEALEEHVSALQESASAAQDAAGAEIDWEETLDTTTEAIKKRGRATDNDTEKGRENNRALLDMARAGWQVVEAQVAQGDSTKTVTQTAQEARSAFIAAAEDAGYGADAAAKLADAYGLIPGNVETMVQAEGTEQVKKDLEDIPETKETEVKTSESGATDAAAAIESIPESKNVELNVTDNGGAQGVQGAVDGLQGRNLDIKVSDQGTAKEVQAQVDGLKGKNLDITLRITNLASIQQSIADLTRPRSIDVTVNQRQGRKVTP